MFYNDDGEDVDYIGGSWLCVDNDIKIRKLNIMISDEKAKQARHADSIVVSRMLVDALELERQEVLIIP